MIRISTELFSKWKPSSSSTNIIAFHFGKYRQFTIRFYDDKGYGFRSLCYYSGRFPKRFSIDLWRFGFVFENYKQETE